MNAPGPINRLVLAGTEAARQFFADQFERGRETLWIAHLDDDARCLHLAKVDGDVCGADFPLRAIIADALRHGSKGIVLAHNHPSGDPRPSGADLSVTRRLAAAADAIDVTLVDHLVFAGGDMRSYRRMGLL